MTYRTFQEDINASRIVRERAKSLLSALLLVVVMICAGTTAVRLENSWTACNAARLEMVHD